MSLTSFSNSSKKESFLSNQNIIYISYITVKRNIFMVIAEITNLFHSMNILGHFVLFPSFNIAHNIQPFKKHIANVTNIDTYFVTEHATM